MKVVNINYSDSTGGAARAAYRIHNAVKNSGIESTMWVNHSASRDFSVWSPGGSFDKGVLKFRSILGQWYIKILKSIDKKPRSAAILPSKWVGKITQSDIDLAHLHWINAEMLSIEDIGRINKPIIWTIHDMWPFCGTEHYTEDLRWQTGYFKSNRSPDENGIDLNKLTWKRKKKSWKRPLQIVAPSVWLADCVKRSALMNEWPVEMIPNPLNTNIWQPTDKITARHILGLPAVGRLVLFGAIGGEGDPRKGFDLLKESLGYLRQNNDDIVLVIFGQNRPKFDVISEYQTYYFGHLNDDISLKLLYSAADVMIVPSRQEAFGQTASEASACGTPIVGFKVGGLIDIVKHKETGYLAQVNSTLDMANGINWVLANDERIKTLGAAARNRATSLWSYEVVGKQYAELYSKVIENSKIDVRNSK